MQKATALMHPSRPMWFITHTTHSCRTAHPSLHPLKTNVVLQTPQLRPSSYAPQANELFHFFKVENLARNYSIVGNKINRAVPMDDLLRPDKYFRQFFQLDYLFAIMQNSRDDDDYEIDERFVDAGATAAAVIAGGITKKADATKSTGSRALETVGFFHVFMGAICTGVGERLFETEKLLIILILLFRSYVSSSARRRTEKARDFFLERLYEREFSKILPTGSL